MNPKTRLLILSVLALAAIGGVVMESAIFVAGRYRTTTTGTALIGGPFTLVATDGTTVTDQTYRGKWLVIFFGYTSCPDACPTSLSNMSVALEKLGSDASKLQPVFITVDPQRDTREVMAQYLKSFDSRIVGLTGSPPQIEAVVKEYRVYVAPQKTDDKDYLVDHSAYFYLMDPQGTFVNVFTGLDGEEMADRLRKEIN